MKIEIFALLILIQIIVIPSVTPAQKREAARIFHPPELRGSKEQRVQQNMRANNLGIVRITMRTELEMLAGVGALIELTDADYYIIDPKPEKICTLNAKGRYKVKTVRRRIFVYPAVKQYLDWLAGEYFAKFRTKLKITSGARSLEEQISMRTRGSLCFTTYAAEASIELEESLHIRGIAVDISRKVILVLNKKGKQKERWMLSREIAWMRARLIEDKKTRGIEAEEELSETLKKLEVEPTEESICYHIVIFPKPR